MKTPSRNPRPVSLTLILLTAGLAFNQGALAMDEIVIEDDPESGEIMIDDGLSGDDGIVIDPATSGAGDGGEDVIIGDEAPAARVSSDEAGSDLRLALDEARLEFGHLPDGASAADSLAYAKLAASLRLQTDPQWELQLAGRIDGYEQDGDHSWSTGRGDYGDSFLRFRGDTFRVTAGTQTVIWGRLDELPLSDRVSTADLTRFILDDLEDRRRSNPMLRVESRLGGGQLDLVWLADFRAAELPGQKSIWYPIDQERGRILGIDPADIPAAAVRNARIIEDEPDGDGGFGARYTRTHSFADIGVTFARTRQSVPYYRVTGNGDLKTEHPRSWATGVDAAVDAAGATWRAELLYSSDNPVTRRKDLRYTTVAGLAWGLGVEMHPGDGDTRVNLQLVGANLIDSPDILDRTEIYSLNGEVEMPFDRERWRASLDFFAGLDQKDIYLNPELAFLGWEPHEVYVAVHYFDGHAQTLGGFHEDHSSINLGWRAKF